MSGPRNIVLTGFMGTGKSAVAAELARLARLRSVEVDEEIERTAGMSIREIFAEYDESRFRELETREIQRIAALSGQVISTGGGAVMKEENMEALSASGVIVCLSARPETILKRTARNSDRPLLNVPDPMKKINELLSLRKPYYEKADFTVDTEGKTPLEIAEEILELTGWKS